MQPSSTNDAPPPVFTDAPSGCLLTDFLTLSVDDVITAVRRLPDKQCASDPMPTSLLRENCDLLAPFLVELFNRSLLQGTVPTVFKSAYITPLLKKPDLDPAENKSYRPISNLSVLSKTLERLVARQLLDYLYAADLQSAYRANHSTETAVLKVLSDILRAVDGGDLAALALLDLSAAFDTVDHETLLHRLKQSYGLGGRVHDWFQSYLSGRFQSVHCGGTSSTRTELVCGVPQGSVLGRFCFYCTRQICFDWFVHTAWTLTSTQMMCRYMASVSLMAVASFRAVCLTACAMWASGCVPTDFSSTPTRLRSSGSLRLVASTRSRRFRSLSAPTSSHPSHQFETWASTSTQICRCGRTFPGRCQRALRLSARSEAFAGRSPGQCCGRWSQL